MTPREKIMADIGLIALRHGLTRHDLIGPRRIAKIMNARKECYVLLRSRGMSYPQIGRIFNRHHTTIIDAMPYNQPPGLPLTAGASEGVI